MRWRFYKLCERRLNRLFPNDLIAVGECSDGRPCILTSGGAHDFNSIMELIKFVWSVK